MSLFSTDLCSSEPSLQSDKPQVINRYLFNGLIDGEEGEGIFVGSKRNKPVSPRLLNFRKIVNSSSTPQINLWWCYQIREKTKDEQREDEKRKTQILWLDR